MQIDEADRRILRHWLAEPGLERAALAERAGVTPATLWRRLDRLRDGGVIADGHDLGEPVSAAAGLLPLV